MIKKILLIIIILMNLIFCGKKKSVNKVEKKSSISFKDSSGRVVNLEKAAEKIVILPFGGSSILMALDQSSHRLVGIGLKFKKGILTEFFPKLLTIKNNLFKNRKLNIEELVKINPNLVIAWGHSDIANKQVDQIENLGLKAATFNWSLDKDVISQNIKTIAHSIQKIEKANKLIKWRNNLRNKLKSQVKNISNKNRNKILYFFDFKNYKILDRSIIHYIFNVKDLENYKKIKKLNVEQILKWDPEIMLLGSFQSNGIPEDIYKNELFSEMKAVKNRKIYKMPYTGHKMSVAGSGSHEDPLTWMWMSMILYPNYFNYDLRKEIKDWYKMMYGKIPTESQIDELLCIKLNQNSKNYEKFSKN